MRQVIGIFVFLSCLSWATTRTFAEPVDKNRSGGLLGGRMEFGPVYAVGDSKPGMGWLLLAEPGYGFALSTWNRMEVTVELGMGHLSFKRESVDDTINLPINMIMLAKGGYGYTVGENVFGIIQFGAGPVMGKYSGKAKDAVDEIDENLTGFAATLGLDVFFPVNDNLRLFGGGHLKYMTFNGDDIDSFQINMPVIAMGASYAF